MFSFCPGVGWWLVRSRARKGRMKCRFGPRKGNTCHSHLAFLGSCLYTCTQLCPTLPVLFSYVFLLFSLLLLYALLCSSFMLLPYYFFTFSFTKLSYNIWFPFGLVGGDGWCGLGPRKVGWKADSGPERGTLATAIEHSWAPVCTLVVNCVPLYLSCFPTFSYYFHMIFFASPLCSYMFLLSACPLLLLYLFFYEAFLYNIWFPYGWCGLGPRKADSGPERGTLAIAI